MHEPVKKYIMVLILYALPTGQIPYIYLNVQHHIP